MASTIRQEAEVARRHCPAFAWPTLALAMGLVTGFISVTWLAAAGVIPLWLGGVINFFFLYSFYTPVHESCHGAIIPRRKGWNWIHAAVGMACAAPIWMFYHHHRKSHFLHHARTNHDDDPDLYAKGSFVQVFFVQIPGVLIGSFNPFALWSQCRKFDLSRSEITITMGLFALQSAVVVGVLAMGWWVELVVLWLVPWFTSNLLMQTTFGWAPHHNHSEIGRYRDTRIALFPGGDLLLLFQNLHLVHHMMPMVPFYRYRAVFEETRPWLEQNGARIEGFWPSTPEQTQAETQPA